MCSQKTVFLFSLYSKILFGFHAQSQVFYGLLRISLMGYYGKYWNTEGQCDTG